MLFFIIAGQQPRSTYLFLGNVALSDLLTGIAVLFGHFFPRKYRCELSCSIQIGMNNLTNLIDEDAQAQIQNFCVC